MRTLNYRSPGDVAMDRVAVLEKREAELATRNAELELTVRSLARQLAERDEQLADAVAMIDRINVGMSRRLGEAAADRVRQAVPELAGAAS